MHVIFTIWMPLVADCNGISNTASGVQPNFHLQWAVGATMSPLQKPPYVARQSKRPDFPGLYVPLLEILWALLAPSTNSPAWIGQNGFHLLQSLMEMSDSRYRKAVLLVLALILTSCVTEGNQFPSLSDVFLINKLVMGNINSRWFKNLNIKKIKSLKF